MSLDRAAERNIEAERIYKQQEIIHRSVEKMMPVFSDILVSGSIVDGCIPVAITYDTSSGELLAAYSSTKPERQDVSTKRLAVLKIDLESSFDIETGKPLSHAYSFGDIDYLGKEPPAEIKELLGGVLKKISEQVF